MCLMMQKMGDGIREDGLVRAMIKRGESGEVNIIALPIFNGSLTIRALQANPLRRITCRPLVKDKRVCVNSIGQGLQDKLKLLVLHFTSNILICMRPLSDASLFFFCLPKLRVGRA